MTQPLPIRTETEGPAAVISGGVIAVLTELVAKVEAFIESAEPEVIDLRTLPLTHADKEGLREVLGEGEVRVRLDIMGTSQITETAFAGIWWITHRGPTGSILAETIEITRVPEILVVAQDDIATGAARLDETIKDLVETAKRGEETK